MSKIYCSDCLHCVVKNEENHAYLFCRLKNRMVWHPIKDFSYVTDCVNKGTAIYNADKYSVDNFLESDP